VDFHGGPRDGDRIVVEGKPTIFDLPVEMKGERAGEVWVRYEFRGGAYHYVGQVEKLRGKG
jgi:hypothetical protein